MNDGYSLTGPLFSKFLVVLLVSESCAFATPVVIRQQFMSTVQLAIREPSPDLLRRSQKLVMSQMQNTFQSWPELTGKHFEIRTVGNEVILSLVTNDDMRIPMQQAVAAMIDFLNGRVRASGRSSFYRAPLERSAGGGYLEAVMDDSRTKIRSLSAQGVPLRDLLKEIKTRAGRLSYLIPGECADALVDWEYSGQSGGPELKPAIGIGEAFKMVAQGLGLRYEDKNGTHIFSGDCNEIRHNKRLPSEFVSVGFFPDGARPVQNTQVYLPLMPLGD
jgi:hypothetical protein